MDKNSSIDKLLVEARNSEYPVNRIGMTAGHAKAIFRALGFRVPLILRGMTGDRFVWLYRNGNTVEIEDGEEHGYG